MAVVPSRHGALSPVFFAKANPGQIRGILRVLSLLVWKKSDLLCRISRFPDDASTHLKVDLCDQAVSISATAVLKNDLFVELQAPLDLSFGVSLVHLVHALNLFASPAASSATTVVTMRYPCDDGRLVLESGEPGRANRIRIVSQRCAGMDFRFHDSGAPILDAVMKAELLKEIAEGLEEAVSPQKPAESDAQIIFSAARQTLTFKTTGAGGSVCFNLTATDEGRWISHLDIKQDGETRVRLDLLTNTVKTDYFRDLVNKGQPGTLMAAFSQDKLTLRINAKRQLCLLYHIKPVDGGATSGVECVINPMAEEDFIAEAP